jgi:mxaJ protein
MALSRYGVIGNLRGYNTSYDENIRPEDIINGVANKDVDVAIVWGPMAGYFVKKASVPLVLTPIAAEKDSATGFPMQYEIGMAVRRQDKALRDSLQTLLDRRASDIQAILQGYGVPVIPLKTEAPADSGRAAKP